MWDVVEQRVEQFGPLNEYSVNWMWGTTGLGYNEGMINERMENAPQLLWRWSSTQTLYLNSLIAVFIY